MCSVASGAEIREVGGLGGMRCDAGHDEVGRRVAVSLWWLEVRPYGS